MSADPITQAFITALSHLNVVLLQQYYHVAYQFAALRQTR